MPLTACKVLDGSVPPMKVKITCMTFCDEGLARFCSFLKHCSMVVVHSVEEVKKENTVYRIRYIFSILEILFDLLKGSEYAII